MSQKKMQASALKIQLFSCKLGYSTKDGDVKPTFKYS